MIRNKNVKTTESRADSENVSPEALAGVAAPNREDVLPFLQSFCFIMDLL
jgi:hypothetical protein